MNTSKDRLAKMSSQEIINISNQTLLFELSMLRRIPHYIRMLKPSENYEKEVKEYAQLISDLADNAHTIPEEYQEMI